MKNRDNQTLHLNTTQKMITSDVTVFHDKWQQLVHAGENNRTVFPWFPRIRTRGINIDKIGNISMMKPVHTCGLRGNTSVYIQWREMSEWEEENWQNDQRGITGIDRKWQKSRSAGSGGRKTKNEMPDKEEKTKERESSKEGARGEMEVEQCCFVVLQSVGLWQSQNSCNYSHMRTQSAKCVYTETAKTTTAHMSTQCVRGWALWLFNHLCESLQVSHRTVWCSRCSCVLWQVCLSPSAAAGSACHLHSLLPPGWPCTSRQSPTSSLPLCTEF